MGRASGGETPGGGYERVAPARQRVGEPAGHAFDHEGFGAGEPAGSSTKAAPQRLDQSEFDVVDHAGDADQLGGLVEQTNPDVAIIDVRMPPTHTVRVIVIGICYLRNVGAAQPQLAHETARA